MLFSELSQYLEELEKTSSRLKITEILAGIIEKADASEIDKVCNLVLGQLAPSYKGVVFNLAERLMFQVAAMAYGKSVEDVRAKYKNIGDLGETIFYLSEERLRENNRLKKEVNVVDVYDKLMDIATEKGDGSQDRKIEKASGLLSCLSSIEAKYVSRIILGRLRLGFSDRTILDALSWFEFGNKSRRKILEKAYQVVPDVGLLAKKVKEVGIDRACLDVKPVVGIPVLPMLAQRLKSPKEMIEKMGKVFVEPKFDGLRILIHFKRGEVKDDIWAFTRNLNDVREMFPELEDIGRHIAANEVILDSEAVGMDPEMKRIAEFQVTMQRRRKYEIDKKQKEIPLKFQVFDILYKDGESCMDMPYYKRREILENLIKDKDLLVVDEAVETVDPAVINSEYTRRINDGLEGIIVKKFDTPYIPGRTGWRWVKMKEEEKAVGKLVDTLDCVVMGYYLGRGKRTRFGIGGFLVGVLDGEVIKTITKIGTGLTDEQFKEMHRRLKKLEARQKPKEYGEVDKVLIPDSWVTPSLVVEVAADEITKSPVHSSGLALRFPRLVRFRDDKSPDQATTLLEVKKFYKLQRV
jgi:DNA ligase-1